MEDYTELYDILDINYKSSNPNYIYYIYIILGPFGTPIEVINKTTSTKLSMKIYS